MNLRYIDWIWRVRGTIPTDAPPPVAYGRLQSLFEERETIYRVDGDTLTFEKKAPLPQDKMSVFEKGRLQVSGGVLRYDLVSRALLACFLAPLLFFALGHASVAVDNWRNPPELAKAKAEAAKKRSKVKPEDVPMNPVDQFLGAPKPQKPKDGEEIGKRNRKPSMKTAYAFMGIFFALWVIGRILEHRLIHLRFRRRLTGETADEMVGQEARGAGVTAYQA